MDTVAFAFLLAVAPDPAATAAQRPAPGTDPPSSGEVVVTARRRGDADIPAEREIGEAEIATRAADSIGTLLDRLGPFIDETGEQPVLLVNGRPLGLDRSLLSFPPEALERVAVLPREAAARYGQPGDRRVVNLVLKPSFVSTDAEAGVFGPTAGGQRGGLATARRVTIAGDTRWLANARVERQSTLLRSARDLPARGTAPPGVDSDDFETLLSSRRLTSASVGVTRPIGSLSGSLTLDASDTGGSGLRGIAPAPDGAPPRPLRSNNSARSLAATAALTGNPGGWQTNLSMVATRSTSESLFETAAGSLRNQARGNSLLARLNVNKALLNLPAGPLTSGYTLNVLHNQSRNRQIGAEGIATDIDLPTRRQFDGSVTLGIPLARAGPDGGNGLGRLSAQLSAGTRGVTGSGSRTELGGGLIWAPIRALELRGNVERAGTAPTIEQLDGPLVTIVARVFDFARAETVDIARLTGGNPALLRGRRDQLSLTAKLTPFADQRLTLSSTYRRQSATGGVLAFPELTPVIEAAFPERVTRAPDGRLLALDARNIAIESDRTAELFSTLAWRPGRPGAGAKRPAPAAPRWTIEAALSHRWRLRDLLVIRDGVPPIDRLGGDGGQSRHALSLQATLARPGVGMNATAAWSTRTTIRRPGDPTLADFRVQPPLILNLDAFLRPSELNPAKAKGSWYQDTTITLLIQNVLNDFRRITTPDGARAPNSTRDEIDPLGRTIRLVVRKRF